jgi:hypothetical protein
VTDRIEFWEQDRATLRELGTLLDQLDAAAAAGDLDAMHNLVRPNVGGSRVTYLGGYCAGLADREPAKT